MSDKFGLKDEYVIDIYYARNYGETIMCSSKETIFLSRNHSIVKYI